MTCILETPIGRQVASMKPGQMLDVRAAEFHHEFGSINRFLSNCIGSAYGYVRVAELFDRDLYRISRHEGDERADHSGFLYHVDEDRQHLFTKVPGGWQRRP